MGTKPRFLVSELVLATLKVAVLLFFGNAGLTKLYY
jgi:hypothetical protein